MMQQQKQQLVQVLQTPVCLRCCKETGMRMELLPPQQQAPQGGARVVRGLQGKKPMDAGAAAEPLPQLLLLRQLLPVRAWAWAVLAWI
jgi:hypothetical protein